MKFGPLVCYLGATLGALASVQAATLEYSQAIVLLNYTDTYTVPAGKVAKVTYNNPGNVTYEIQYRPSADCSGSAVCVADNATRANIDANMILNSNRVTTRLPEQPLWLPAGTTLSHSATPGCFTVSEWIALYDLSFSPCGTVAGFNLVSTTVNRPPIVSLIEFNVVP